MGFFLNKKNINRRQREDGRTLIYQSPSAHSPRLTTNSMTAWMAPAADCLIVSHIATIWDENFTTGIRTEPTLRSVGPYKSHIDSHKQEISRVEFKCYITYHTRTRGHGGITVSLWVGDRGDIRPTPTR